METKNDQAGSIQLDDTSIEFLLHEYDRLANSEVNALQNYTRLFSIYLTAIAAALTIALPIVKSLAISDQMLITIAILTGLLVFGLATFAGLSNTNAIRIHIARARMLIQDYYLQNDFQIRQFLYYRVAETGLTGTSPWVTIVRGIFGGGPATITVIFNSLIASILTMVLLSSYYRLTPIAQIIIGVVVFLVLVVFHLVYHWTIYALRDIHRPTK